MLKMRERQPGEHCQEVGTLQAHTQQVEQNRNEVTHE